MLHHGTRKAMNDHEELKMDSFVRQNRTTQEPDRDEKELL